MMKHIFMAIHDGTAKVRFQHINMPLFPDGAKERCGA